VVVPWLKMRLDIHDDPAVIAIGEALKIDEDSVVGKLQRLWAWSNLHTVDGNAPGVTDSWVDRYLGAPGFAKAMSLAGWLQISAKGIVFPNFDRHNSETAKQRALTALRVANHKAKRTADGNADGNADSVSDALPSWSFADFEAGQAAKSAQFFRVWTISVRLARSPELGSMVVFRMVCCNTRII
jgi:hypothetical protein